MNVAFHALASFGISHAAARGLDATAPTGGPARDARVLVPAFVAGVLSHGVLDGLKHGYPVPYTLDPPLALAMLGLWLALVSRRYRPLVVATFAGAVLPDVVDLGPGVANHLFGTHLPKMSHVFPWHWLDGSGSMYPAKPGVVTSRAALNTGDNQAVSITNHVLVVFFSLAAILANRRPFRFVAALTPVRGGLP